jgi:hypothetical protein
MKSAVVFVGLLALAVVVSSCATLYGGKLHPSQTAKPRPGEPKRKIRWGMIVTDLLGLQTALYSIPIDFLTRAIYRPVLTDSVRTAQIQANRLEKRYVSVGSNLLPLMNNTAELTSEIRFHPAFGFRLSALRAWGGRGETFSLRKDFVEDRLTTGWSGQLGVRWYPVATFSPEIRSPAEFYFGADLLGTSFEQQARVPEAYTGTGTSYNLVRQTDGDRFMGYALSYGTLVRMSKRLHLDVALQYGSRFSNRRSYLNAYLPGLGFDPLGPTQRMRFGFSVRYSL